MNTNGKVVSWYKYTQYGSRLKHNIVSRFVMDMDVGPVDMPVNIYDLWVGMDIVSMREIL